MSKDKALWCSFVNGRPMLSMDISGMVGYEIDSQADLDWAAADVVFYVIMGAALNQTFSVELLESGEVRLEHDRLPILATGSSLASATMALIEQLVDGYWHGSSSGTSAEEG